MSNRICSFKVYSVPFLVILIISACRDDNSIESITEEDLRIHMQFMASNALQGREAGEPGNQAAAQYLVSELKQLGLSSADSTGNYMQYLDSIDFLAIKGKNQIEIMPKDGNNSIIIGDVFLNLSQSAKSLDIKSNLCFAGYGYIGSRKPYNDFENLDIKDKVVMLLTGIPFSSNQGSLLYSTEIKKLEYLQKQKPKAILWVFDHTSSENNFYSFRNRIIKEEELQDTLYDSLNIFFITKNTADLILSISDKNLSDIQKKISETKCPYSFDFSDLKIKIDINRKKSLPEAANVIGIIEGNDPDLKEECIIYTAHYDHVGFTSDDKIFNGADDNASGTVALLEIAEAFIKMKKKPKRSIVFAWMTAEEKGLIGSSFYTEHPIFPIENTIACINLDMIGRVKTKETSNFKYKHNLKTKDSILVVSGFQSTELMEINKKHLKALQLAADYNGKKLMKNSDHYPFYEKGIPILFYTTGLHPDYHTINDTEDKIDYSKIKKIAQLAYLVGLDVANNQDRLK